jgi:hypothetical protein
MQMTTTDWRKILIAYINHVGECEGADFLRRYIPGLSLEENLELHRAASEGIVSKEHRQKLLDWRPYDGEEANVTMDYHAVKATPDVSTDA